MSRSTDKVPLIIAVFEQNIYNSNKQLDYAIAEKDYVRALTNQIKVDTATELLGVVKALGIKPEKESTK